MPISKVTIEEFLKFDKNIPILDARSPAEHAHAHIPGAVSFPIFSDEERARIGTAYKQESREKAIKIGLDAFGKKMLSMVETLDAYFTEHKISSKEVRVHCWRGGMRSATVAWLLDLYGYKVYLLTGGYKVYRNRVLQQFEKNYRLKILGGYTGGNKTGALQELKKMGEAVIDLEGLAGHKGSAFGNLDSIPQPGQEHFENLLAFELEKESSIPHKMIWVEGESQRIGLVNIPKSFFINMRNSTLLFLDIPFEQRLDHILSGYGKYEKEHLIGAILRIKKRLGGLETKNAINALLEDNVRECFAILLHYYDKLYLKSTLNKTEGEREITYLNSASTDAKLNATKLVSDEFNR
ncbi:MAG: tRNA 2-selenouridine(34) synthase MnmH [bacterium]|nr:tRNA 2-selenouridine(34) synthase MnmH [bacterium]